jgi:hypothetical protein
MTDPPDAIRAAVEQRFAQVGRSPDKEKKLPVGRASAKKLGLDPQEIDALPASVTESFWGVGIPLGRAATVSAAPTSRAWSRTTRRC